MALPFRQKAMVRPNTPSQDACDTYMKLVCVPVPLSPPKYMLS